LIKPSAIGKFVFTASTSLTAAGIAKALKDDFKDSALWYLVCDVGEKDNTLPVTAIRYKQQHRIIILKIR
jgi:hypothetical protein